MQPGLDYARQARDHRWSRRDTAEGGSSVFFLIPARPAWYSVCVVKDYASVLVDHRSTILVGTRPSIALFVSSCHRVSHVALQHVADLKDSRVVITHQSARQSPILHSTRRSRVSQNGQQLYYRQPRASRRRDGHIRWYTHSQPHDGRPIYYLGLFRAAVAITARCILLEVCIVLWSAISVEGPYLTTKDL
jgi:hypothetical protein